jgi:hypothetical protein
MGSNQQVDGREGFLGEFGIELIQVKELRPAVDDTSREARNFAIQPPGDALR